VTFTRLDPVSELVIPSLILFPPLAVTQNVARVQGTEIKLIVVLRRAQVLCRLYFSCYDSRSFETDSELTRIEQNAFAGPWLKSITIPGHLHHARHFR
jgi:hypothetical protein